MPNPRRWVVGLMGLYLCLASLSTQAIEPLRLTPGQQHYSVGPHVEYLEDKQSQYSFEQVSSPAYATRFIAGDKAVPNFGFSTSTYWLHFRLRNETPSAHNWLLENQYPLLDHLALYLVDAQGKVTLQKTGDVQPFYPRELKHKNLIFNINLLPGQETSVYLRVQSTSSVQLPLVLWTERAFLAKDHEEQYFFGIFYGILLAMLLYNVLIYLSIRDINYLHYVNYILGFGLFQMSLNGLAFEYLWPSYPAWGNTAIPFFMGSALWALTRFSRSFLELNKHIPKLDFTMRVLSVYFIVTAIGSMILPYQIIIKFATFGAILAGLGAFAAAFICWLRKVKQARYFLLAWTTFTVGIIVYALKTFNVLPTVFITEYGLQIGFALGVILLSFALAHRMKLLKEENERIQQEATAMLESRVQARTQELNVALRDLSHANETLKDLSIIDGLTGVKNRKHFDDAFKHEWNVAQRGQYPIAILMLDIDHFKNVNDTCGHLGGDEALKAVARTLKKHLKRPADVVARYGGEEFAIILPFTDEDGAIHLAEEIRQGVESLKIDYASKPIPLTISIGVAVTVPKRPENPDALLSTADSALYEAKRLGRNRVMLQRITVGKLNL